MGVSVPPGFDGVFWDGVEVGTPTGGKGSMIGVIEGVSVGRSDEGSGKYGGISSGPVGIGRPAAPPPPKLTPSGPVVNKAGRKIC